MIVDISTVAFALFIAVMAGSVIGIVVALVGIVRIDNEPEQEQGEGGKE